MKKLLFIVVIFLLSGEFANAQRYSTCSVAAEVSSESFGPVAPNGAVDKSVAKHHSHGLFFEEEHNITWIAFDIPCDTMLTFDIFPQKAGDDIDFLLFKDDEDLNELFCKKIEEHKLTPIRTNLAKPDSNTPKCSTGLSLTATDTIVPVGYNPNYSKALKVKKGERYYLVIDNYTEAKGAFILALHLKFPVYTTVQTVAHETVRNMDAPDIKAPKLTKFGKTNLTIQVRDSAGHDIKAQLDISGARPGQITSADTASLTYTLIPRITININCNALGYMFSETTFTSPDTASDITLPIIMSPVREHQSFVMKDIKFQEGVAIFLPTSQNELANLLEFMKNNPSIGIIIKGYVNDPGSDNSGAAKKLSKQRAQAVYSFLAAAGVSKKRMDFKGYGNEKMIYPHPINERQAETNRRVEIEVVK
jgi:outer membrane protein OmpA-like peptidoglycan-associated protein